MIQPQQRRRGGQPGNRNAKNNRGNRQARGMRGNRGGRGAPLFNQHAAKRVTLDAALRSEFGNDRTVLDWIEQNSDALSEFVVSNDFDRASSMFGRSIDSIAATGQELSLGIFEAPDVQ